MRDFGETGAAEFRGNGCDQDPRQSGPGQRA